jgi:predicted nucleotide-binding protein
LWLKVKEVADKDVGLIPICYESKPRTGQSIVPILQEMLDQADFAILVMTGEDLTGKGDRRPRQNVVHEAGLFQGRLGFERTVLLVEKGVEFLSNLHGMQVIGFKGDDIEGTFWNLSRVLRRV